MKTTMFSSLALTTLVLVSGSMVATEAPQPQGKLVEIGKIAQYCSDNAAQGLAKFVTQMGLCVTQLKNQLPSIEQIKGKLPTQEQVKNAFDGVKKSATDNAQAWQKLASEYLTSVYNGGCTFENFQQHPEAFVAGALIVAGGTCYGAYKLVKALKKTTKEIK